jgi:tetratricopeptide (TPR) repeat protein
VSLGLIQAEVGKPDDAIASYKRALAIDSTNVRALCNLGNSQYGMGRIADATSLYRKALKIDPRNQEAIYNMAVAFADAQIYREAINYWQKVVEIDSTAVIAQSAKSSIQVLGLPQPAKAGAPQNSTTPPAQPSGSH